MQSLQQIAATTESFNVLTAIKHAILGYNRENAGCIKDFLPVAYRVDLTEEDLMPQFRRVNEIRMKRNSNLPSGMEMLRRVF
jgi:hypothetical protein